MIHNCCRIRHMQNVVYDADKDYHLIRSDPNTHIVDSIIWCCGFVIIDLKMVRYAKLVRCNVSEEAGMKVFVWRIFEKVPSHRERIGWNIILIVQNSYPFIAGRRFFVAFLRYLQSFGFASLVLNVRSGEGNCRRWKAMMRTHSLYTVEVFDALFPFLSERCGRSAREFMMRVYAMCVHALKDRKKSTANSVRKVVGNHNQRTHSTH